MTVTSADAKYQSLPVMTLAKEWSATLQTALITALQKRQPAVVRRNVVTIWIVGGVLVLATVLAWAIVAAIRRRTRSLHQLVDQRTRELESAQSDAKPEDGDSARRQLRFFGLAIRLADPQLSLTVYNAFEALIVWLMVLAWFGATVWVLSLFPETTPLSQILRHRASAIVVVVVVAILLVKACEIAVARIARAAAERAELGLRSDKTRQLLRIPTIARATTASVTFVIGFVCVLGVINQLGFSTGSVLTLGGIAALGISLAAQNLVRDFLGGFLVLVEDQYVVGDYVTIGETSGIVERMTLRVAQIRDASGNLVTIPYGGVTQVINGSRDWSRVDFRFVIDPVSEVGPSLELFRSTLASIGAMKEWNGVILDAEEWSGVEYVSATGIILRASVKTAPLRQFEVKRELYAVMADAFEKAGIPLGIDPKFGGAPIASAPPNISKPPVK
jgi:small conductance mechanosensitive channel